MYFCLDLGGSSVKIGILDHETHVLEHDSMPVAPTFEGMIDNICEKLEVFKKKYDIEGIAISAPGSVDIETGIIYGSSAIPYIHGPNWKKILKERTGYDISIENDANCAGLAEAYSGVAKDCHTMALLVLGTGVGGCLIQDQKVLHGAHLHGGEVGYQILGKRDGQWVTLSGSGAVGALVRWCKKRGLQVINGKEVFAYSKKGNVIALEEIDRFYEAIALGIFNLQYTYDPEVIVISGAISSNETLLPSIKKHMKQLLEDYENHAAKIEPEIVIAHYKGDANLVGALVNYFNCYKN